MSELTKKRVHWKEYNGEELVHDEDVDVLTSAGAVTFSDGEDLQYKYTQGQFVNPSMTGSLTNLSTTNKSSLVDAINEVKTDATSNESSIDSLTNRATTSENDIDSLEGRMTTVESDIDNVETRMTTAESDIDSVEGRMSTAESDVDSLEGRMTTAESDVDGLESDVTSLEGRMTTAESGIDSLGTRMSTAESDIDSLETRTTTAENDIDELESRITPISLGGTGATTASAAIANLHGVEMTTDDITYYVSPSGSDANDGLTEDTPFATIQHALDVLPKYLAHDVTINVAQGTYTENEVLITGFIGEGALSIVGTYNATGAENYIFSNGIKVNKNQGRVEFHGIGSSKGFQVFNSMDVVFYYCHAYSPSLVEGRAGFYSTHSKAFTVYCKATNIQHGFYSYQAGELTAMGGVCTNCPYPWCSYEGAILYAYGCSSSGYTTANNYGNAGIIVSTSGGYIG